MEGILNAFERCTFTVDLAIYSCFGYTSQNFYLMKSPTCFYVFAPIYALLLRFDRRRP